MGGEQLFQRTVGAGQPAVHGDRLHQGVGQGGELHGVVGEPLQGVDGVPVRGVLPHRITPVDGGFQRGLLLQHPPGGLLQPIPGLLHGVRQALLVHGVIRGLERLEIQHHASQAMLGGGQGAQEGFPG